MAMNRHSKRTLTVPTVLFVVVLSSYGNAQIRHRFIATNEPARTLEYVDQFDTTKNKSIPLGLGDMYDLQLIGNNRVLVSHGSGYAEVDILTGAKIKTFSKGKGTHSAERLVDGRTVLAGNGLGDCGGASFVILDSKDSVIRTVCIPGTGKLRHVRSTSSGSLIFATLGNVIETKFDGTVLRKMPLSGGLFKTVCFPDGKTVTSRSPGSERKLFFLDSNGVTQRTILGDSLPGGSFTGFHFITKNSIVVTNWLGHDAMTGIDLYQYDSTGAIVWKYGRANASFVETIVLDNLNTWLLHNEKTGILAPDTGLGVTALHHASPRKIIDKGTSPLRSAVFLNGKTIPMNNKKHQQAGTGNVAGRIRIGVLRP